VSIILIYLSLLGCIKNIILLLHYLEDLIQKVKVTHYN
jgi:hypothetical protein